MSWMFFFFVRGNRLAKETSRSETMSGMLTACLQMIPTYSGCGGSVFKAISIRPVARFHKKTKIAHQINPLSDGTQRNKDINKKVKLTLPDQESNADSTHMEPIQKLLDAQSDSIRFLAMFPFQNPSPRQPIPTVNVTRRLETEDNQKLKKGRTQPS